jgi:hypothetical protein
VNILEQALKALALLSEGEELLKKVSSAAKGIGDGLSTTDREELDTLLAEGTARRRAASAELEEALNSLK